MFYHSKSNLQPGFIVTNKNLLQGILVVAALLFGLTGCDIAREQLGVETSRMRAEAEANAKAVGGACRESGRAIEDCYTVYSWLNKAFIYQGWREMDVYMRDNQIETVRPLLPPVAAPPPRESQNRPAARGRRAAPPERAPAPATPATPDTPAATVAPAPS